MHVHFFSKQLLCFSAFRVLEAANIERIYNVGLVIFKKISEIYQEHIVFVPSCLHIVLLRGRIVNLIRYKESDCFTFAELIKTRCLLPSKLKQLLRFKRIN